MTDASPGDIVLVTWLDASVGVDHYWRTPEVMPEREALETRRG